MEKDKGRERARDGGHGVLVYYFSAFSRCSRRVFLYLYGVLEGERHGVVFLSSVRCLRRLLFTSLYFATPKSRRVCLMHS